jgi:hypothetical protein
MYLLRRVSKLWRLLEISVMKIMMILMDLAINEKMENIKKS